MSVSPASPTSRIRTILVTGVGDPAGRSLCRQLRRLRKDLRLVAVDAREVSHCADTLVTGPSADSPAFLPFLQAVIAEHDVDLLIPTVREELPVIAESTAQLGTRVLLSGPDAVAACPDHTPIPSGGLRYCPQVYRSPVDGSVTTVLLQKMASTGLTACHREAVLRIGRSTAPDVAQLAESTVQARELQGPVQLDIHRDGSGELRVVHIRATFGAYSALAPELLTGLLADAAQLTPAAPMPAPVS